MDFETVEDAIVSELKNANNMQYLKLVDSYEGQLEEADIKKLIIKFPAALVVYRGGPLTWVDGQTHNHKPTYAVLCAGKNLKKKKEARKNPDTGAYRIMRDVITELTNKTFDLDIEKLRPGRIYLVFTSGSFAVYGVDFETDYDETYNV